MTRCEIYLTFLSVFFLIMWILAILQESRQSRIIIHLQSELRYRDASDAAWRKRMENRIYNEAKA